ncbi:uncharacterized protein Dvar_19270 [Desulfosarcina variabilis str. Montpellier]|uniref:hypothetical protein n=1 Tax=Desulfosarcina variabilis TaxID=2300 RepID=UPI003AFA6E3B
MAKSQEDIAADLIHAVLDFIHQTEFEDVMPAIYRLIRAVWPDSTEIDLKVKTLSMLNNEIAHWQKKVRESFFLLMDTLKKGRQFEFEQKTPFMVQNNKWCEHIFNEDLEIFEEQSVTIRSDWKLIYGSAEDQKRYEDDVQVLSVPYIIAKFFNSFKLFPFDSIKECDECGNYFFDNRGYKRRFCSKACSTRFTVRESRAKKAMAKKKKGKK